MVDMEYSLSVLAASQVDVYKAQDKLEEAVQGMFVEIKYKLSEVERGLKIAQTKKVEDKLKLYSMYTSRKSLTIREMSKELGVSERTVDYWLSELRELLGIK
uniref:M protein trans-acting positive regulator (MGA) HTH domain-containing protein n=1 Tax=Scylla olivacea TaxID=85551 RepID=A0A0N7Z9P4_SCYOL